MQVTIATPTRRLTAKELIDRTHKHFPATRPVDNRRKGRVARDMIVDGGIGVILDQRARFEHGADKESPVNTAVYEIPAYTNVDVLARELAARLLGG
jgi:hypothetical protein